MSQITRTWLAFIAFGTAVIHLALVIGSPLPIAIALVVLGAAEATWGVLVLVKDRLLVPRLAWAGALAPIILWSLLMVMATLLGAPFLANSLSFIPMAAATLFELVIAGVLSVQLRRRADGNPPKTYRAPGVGRYLISLFAGGLVVALVTTPALAFTQAGLDNPHGRHSYDLTTPGHAGH